MDVIEVQRDESSPHMPQREDGDLCSGDLDLHPRILHIKLTVCGDADGVLVTDLCANTTGLWAWWLHLFCGAAPRDYPDHQQETAHFRQYHSASLSGADTVKMEAPGQQIHCDCG